MEEQKIEQLQRDLERSSPEEKAPKEDAGDDSDEQEKQTRPQVDLQEEVVCLPEKKTPERKQQCHLEVRIMIISVSLQSQSVYYPPPIHNIIQNLAAVHLVGGRR